MCSLSLAFVRGDTHLSSSRAVECTRIYSMYYSSCQVLAGFGYKDDANFYPIHPIRVTPRQKLRNRSYRSSVISVSSLIMVTSPKSLTNCKPSFTLAENAMQENCMVHTRDKNTCIAFKPVLCVLVGGIGLR